MKAIVSIIMGSTSDLKVMEKAAAFFNEMEIPFEMNALSAHRTPAEVEKDVLKHCEIFSKNGGFVFNTVHNIQATVPVENIVAMINAIKKFNGDN